MAPEDDRKKRITDSDRRLEELQRALADAKKDYNLAKTEYEKAQEILKDVGGFGNPDGATARRRANKAYVLYFERYRNALRDYSAFILGKSD